MKIVRALISWDVCEVLGWGFQMNPDRVFSEMVELGLAVTEFDPQGWLPVKPGARAVVMKAHGPTPVGAFLLVTIHDPDHDLIPAIKAELEAFRVAGGSVLVLAHDSGREGYGNRPVPDEQDWATLYHNLDRIAEACAVSGTTVYMYLHQSTTTQNADEMEWVFDEVGVGLHFDMGRPMTGGADSVDIARRHPEWAAIIHAKDVHKELTDKFLTGELTWSESIRVEMFAPTGDGGVDSAIIVSLLNGVGFDGYQVLEQDIMLNEDPALGKGPIRNTYRLFKALESLAG